MRPFVVVLEPAEHFLGGAEVERTNAAERSVTLGGGRGRVAQSVVTPDSSPSDYSQRRQIDPAASLRTYLVAQIFPRWNRLAEWLSRVRHFENAA